MKPKKPTLEDQLAFIATQHEVYPTELFQALIEAKEQGKSMAVADLTVEYRGNVTNQAIFLITKDTKVVAQFRVPEETLARTDVSFDHSMGHKQSPKRNSPSKPSSLTLQNRKSSRWHEKNKCYSGSYAYC